MDSITLRDVWNQSSGLIDFFPKGYALSLDKSAHQFCMIFTRERNDHSRLAAVAQTVGYAALVILLLVPAFVSAACHAVAWGYRALHSRISPSPSPESSRASSPAATTASPSLNDETSPALENHHLSSNESSPRGASPSEEEDVKEEESEEDKPLELEKDEKVPEEDAPSRATLPPLSPRPPKRLKVDFPPLTEGQEKNLHSLVIDIGTKEPKELTKVFSMCSIIKRAISLRNIHPLNLLSTLFGTPQLKQYIPAIWKHPEKRKHLVDRSLTKLEDMAENAERELFPFVEAFCQRIPQMDQQIMRGFIQQRNWMGFAAHLLIQSGFEEQLKDVIEKMR
ncbi:MAG: hypothetical protein KGJ02_05860 [Verrucomicrobiota bacterium]|nr:hypothetical protein [Verrucomicrobiota bacterium]